MDSSMAGNQGNPQDFDFPADPSLLNDPSWSLPPVDQYAHPSQFVQQPSYQQEYATPSQYVNYGASQPSPYTNQSTYGLNYETQSYSGDIGMSQYHMNYLSGSSPLQPQQQSEPFTYPNLSQIGSSTISPQALQRNDVNITQSHVRSGMANVTQRAISNSLANPDLGQQSWSHDATGSFNTNPLINRSEIFSPSTNSTLGAVSYPTFTTSKAPAAGPTTASSRPSSVAAKTITPILPPSRHSSASSQTNTPILPPSRVASALGQTLTPILPPSRSSGAPAHTITPILPPKNVIRSSLKFTHPELLPSVKGNSFLRPQNAQYIVIEDEPVHLELGSKAKLLIPKLKPPKAVTTGSFMPGTAPKTRTKPSISPNKLKSSVQSQVKDIKSRSSAATENKIARSPSPSLVSSSEEEPSSDEDDDDDDDEMEEQLKNLREETRPVDSITAAGWDATGIVWVPRYREAHRDEIIKATPEFEKLIAGLRDELKAVNADVAKADAEKHPTGYKNLKELRIVKRKVLHQAIFKALENGHHDVLRQLGNSQKLVNSLISILIDCIKMEDYGGDLPRAVLKLLAQFTTLNDGLLQKVKFDAVEKRFNKNGDAELKGYIATIRSNTTEAKEKAKRVKEEAGLTDKAKAPSGTKAVKAEEFSKLSSTSGVKRPHDADGSNSKSNKKVASDATSVTSSQKALTTKPRTNFFANLNRPGAKTPAKPTNPALSSTVKKPDPKTESAPQSSNLAAILASIEKPREVPKPVEIPVGPPETPEEKARRQRKESRRHLRVHWKEGDALVEIKLFKHDLAEDEGRQHNMLRDAHDDRSEGMMLKQRVLDGAVDEDEEVDDLNDRPYVEPTLVDFSMMDGREKNFVTKGGNVSFTTPQQKTQEKREAVELMVVYTDPRDIPSSPKEPVNTIGDEPRIEQSLGQPTQDWLLERLKDIDRYGRATAISIANSKHIEKRRASQVSSNKAPRADVTSILNALKAYPQQPAANSYEYRQPSTYPQTSTSPYQISPQQQHQGAASMSNTELHKLLSDIEKNIAPIRGKPFPPTEPPEWMSESGKVMWWEGFNRDKAKKEAMQKKAAEDEALQMQEYVPPPPTIPSTPRPAFDINQLQNILAGLENTSDQKPQDEAQIQNLLAGFGNTNSQMGQNDTQIQSFLAGFNNTNTQTSQTSQTSQDDARIQTLLASFNKPANQNSQANAQVQNYLAGLNQAIQGQAQPQQSEWHTWTTANNAQSYNQTYAANLNHESHNYGSQNQTGRWDSNRKETSRQNNDNQDHSRGGRDGTQEAKELDPRFPGEKRRGKKPCKFWGDGKCVKGNNCGYLHEK